MKEYRETDRYKAYDKARRESPEGRAYDRARKQKEGYKAYQKAYHKEYAKRLQVRLRQALRSRLIYAVKRGRSGAGSAVRDLGCTINELQSYLEGLFKPGTALCP